MWFKNRVFGVRLVFLLMSFGLAFPTPGQAQQCVPAPANAFPNLVSWWRAENNFLDSFDGNHGAPLGIVTFVPGEVGQAFSFNGSSAVRVPSSPSLNFGTGDFSGSFWVKTTAGGGFLNEKDIPGVGAPDWFVHLTGGKVRFVVGQGGDPSAVSSASVNDGVFHHVAFVRQGTSLRVYIDGALSGAATAPFVGNVSNSVPFVIGAEIQDGPNALINTFVGAIDEVALFKRALTPSEIQALAGKDTTPPTITLNGLNPMTLECPTPYVEPGATVKDNCDPSPTLTISGTVDAHTPGTYTITYTATDHSGNTSKIERKVNVQDTQPPTITLNGDNPMTLECSDPYVEPGATATDVCDGPVPVTITGSVNSNAVGTYTLTYTAKDKAGKTATATRTVNVVATTPPFSVDKPLPDPGAHLCLPPFMVQDPSKVHCHWWARATGGGNLEITLIAFSVNSAERGSATIKVFNPSNTQVGTATVDHPTVMGTEASATPVVVSGATAGALYRIEVSVGPSLAAGVGSSSFGNAANLFAQDFIDGVLAGAAGVGGGAGSSSSPPPSPSAQARHYRLELKGASLLGANSKLQAQAEHDDARWGVNVGASEPLDVVVQGGPEAGATTATVEVRKPDGTLATTIGPAAPLPISVNIPGAGASPGMWTVAVLGASVPPPGGGGHYIMAKTSGADRGLYVTWMTWGYGMLSGAITRGGLPNATPVTVEIKDNLTGAVQTIPGVTGSYSAPKLFVGSYTIRVITPPNLLAPPAATRAVTCDAKAIADFDIPNRHPTCEAAAPSIAQIWPPDHKMVDIKILNVTDPDGDPVTITVTKITQDEPLNTLGDGNFQPDGGGIGTSTAQVRAERSGTPKVPGNGRCYHITFTASDGFPQGGTCEGVVKTCVPHDQAHPAVDDGPKFNSVTGAPIVASKPIAALEPEEAPEASLTFGAENYPNPFNPSTTIRYTLPEASNVRLTIYNILGQEVRTLVNATQLRGIHNVQWDGRDAYGRSAASGVYIYRLEAGANVATRNMIFAK